MKILIGGDLVPTQKNIEIFNNAKTEILLGKKLLDLWNSVDVRIFNLETPLVDREDPILKCGPNLIAPRSTIKGIKALNPTLITLANNHIMDQGIRGLDSTIELLNKNNIPFTGVGKNIFEAREGYLIKKNNISVGIYTCTEKEFSIANETQPGANFFDPLETLDYIVNLKAKSDYLIVLYHGGKEHYRYPSPYLQKVCRKLVEKGADLVICQHSHCIGAFEKYKNSTIIYGQGNFIFNKLKNDCWRTSLLVQVDINEENKIEYIPISLGENGVTLAKNREKEDILNQFFLRSEKIKSTNFVEENYKKFVMRNKDFYLSNFAGYDKLFTKINLILKGKLTAAKYDKNNLLMLQNYMECEAHREAVIECLKECINDDIK